MKKTIFSALAFIACVAYANAETRLMAVPTYTQVTKIRGGLFGYKTVTTDTDTNGNSVTVCQDPGTTRCKIQSFARTSPGGPELNPHDYDEIDEQVFSVITEEAPQGSFTYKDDYLVVYRYTVENNTVNYRIFTREGAAAATTNELTLQ